MSDDLPERLREGFKQWYMDDPTAFADDWTVNPLAAAAADRIEQLEAELVAAERARKNNWQHRLNMKSERDEARADNQRLRETLDAVTGGSLLLRDMGEWAEWVERYDGLPVITRMLLGHLHGNHQDGWYEHCVFCESLARLEREEATDV